MLKFVQRRVASHGDDVAVPGRGDEGDARLYRIEPGRTLLRPARPGSGGSDSWLSS